jgi:hypothetical protein
METLLLQDKNTMKSFKKILIAGTLFLLIITNCFANFTYRDASLVTHINSNEFLQINAPATLNYVTIHQTSTTNYIPELPETSYLSGLMAPIGGASNQNSRTLSYSYLTDIVIDENTNYYKEAYTFGPYTNTYSFDGNVLTTIYQIEQSQTTSDIKLSYNEIISWEVYLACRERWDVVNIKNWTTNYATLEEFEQQVLPEAYKPKFYKDFRDNLVGQKAFIEYLYKYFIKMKYWDEQITTNEISYYYYAEKTNFLMDCQLPTNWLEYTPYSDLNGASVSVYNERMFTQTWDYSEVNIITDATYTVTDYNRIEHSFTGADVLAMPGTNYTVLITNENIDAGYTYEGTDYKFNLTDYTYKNIVKCFEQLNITSQFYVGWTNHQFSTAESYWPTTDFEYEWYIGEDPPIPFDQAEYIRIFNLCKDSIKLELVDTPMRFGDAPVSYSAGSRDGIRGFPWSNLRWTFFTFFVYGINAEPMVGIPSGASLVGPNKIYKDIEFAY